MRHRAWLFVCLCVLSDLLVPNSAYLSRTNPRRLKDTPSSSRTLPLSEQTSGFVLSRGLLLEAQHPVRRELFAVKQPERTTLPRPRSSAAHPFVQAAQTHKSYRKKHGNQQDGALDASQIDRYYDASTKTWTVDDAVIDELSRRLDRLFARTEDGDTVLFEVTAPIRPKRKIKIRKNIILTTFVPQPTGAATEALPEAVEKVHFTCPSDEEGLFAIENASVIMANIVIEDCNLVRDIPVTITATPTEIGPQRIVFSNMEFLSNSHPHGSPAIKVLQPSSITMDLDNIKFHDNACQDSMIGVVETSPGTSVRARGISATENHCSVFMVTESELNITDSQFIGNKGPFDEDGVNIAYGAALKYTTSSEGFVSNCLFRGNRANYGGAIYVVDGSEIMGEGLNFQNNHATFGGSVSVINASATISQSVFTSNTAEERGGAVKAVHRSTFSGKDLIIENNSAERGGGSLAVQESSCDLHNVTFSGNSADENGGSVHLIDSSELRASEIVCSDGEADYGGCMFIQQSSAVLSQSSFISNKAHRGGAVYLVQPTMEGPGLQSKKNMADIGGGFVVHQKAELHIEDALFLENKAVEYGGAILARAAVFSGKHLDLKSNQADVGGAMNFHEYCTVEIKDAVFTANVAVAGAGALAIFSSEASIESVILKDNHAAAAGGIYVRTSSATVHGAQFTNNSADTLCGGLFVNMQSTMISSDLNFSRNSAENGGAFCAMKESEATISQSLFESNSAKSDGGGIFASESTIQGDGLTIQRNVAKTGGGIALSSTVATLSALILEQNKAETDGGGIYGNYTSLEVSDLVVEENRAAASGAGMYLVESESVRISNAKLNSNTASGDGGGAVHAEASSIYCHNMDLHRNVGGSGAALHLAGSTISVASASATGNNASVDGGALCIEGEDIALIDLRVENNIAGGDGGGIFSKATGSMKLWNTSLFQNAAAKNGGGLYISPQSVEVKGLKIGNNTAASGGGLYIVGGAAKLQDVSLLENTAQKAGGACFVEETAVEAASLTVHQNVAEIGSGIYIRNADRLFLSESEFHKNRASKDGGAVMASAVIEVMATDLNITKNSARSGSGFLILKANSIAVIKAAFESNIAAERGAAMCVKRSGLARLEDIRVTMNEAALGAGYYLEAVESTLHNSYFTKNTALKHGGAISVNLGNLTATMLHVEDNYAAFGGGINLQETTALFSECSFLTNTAEDGGGAIHSMISSTLLGSQLRFEENEAMFGGAVYASENEVNLTDSVFQNNAASYDGGALTVTLETSFVGTSLVLQRNRATNGGAVTVGYRSRILLEEASFTHNEASELGGAFFALFADRIHWSGVKAVDNQASLNGGAAYFKGDLHVTLSDTHMEKNRALSGGALYAAHKSKIDISDSVVELNMAETEGGAICVEESALSGSNTSIQHNSALHGGGMYVRGGSRLDTRSYRYDNNRAAEHGGALAIDSSKSTCKHQNQNGVFSRNRARYGGAIHFVRQEEHRCRDSSNHVCSGVEFWNTEFTENTALMSGAIAYLSDPFGFRFSCEPKEMTPSIKSLKPIVEGKAAPDDLFCSHWEANTVPDLSVAIEEFGSGARDVEVAVESSDTATNGLAIYNGHEPIVLDNLLGGISLPSIDIKSVDAFGNALEPVEEDHFWAKLVAPEGFFKRGTEIGMKTVDGQRTFGDIACFMDPGTYTLHLLYGNSVLNESTPVILHVTGCPSGQAVDANQKCRPCHAGDFARNGECIHCPEGAVCHGQTIIPDEGRWHRAPCQAQTQSCLVEDACKAANRSGKIETFTEDHPGCKLSEEELSEYNDILCSEGYGSARCGGCQKGYGSWSQLKCSKCYSAGLSVVFLLAMFVWFGILSCVQVFRHSPMQKTKYYHRRSSNRPLLEDGHAGCDGGSFDSVYAHLSGGSGESSDSAVPKNDRLGSGFPDVPSVVDHEEELEREVHKNQYAELIKILVNYLQTTAVLSSLNVRWIPSVQRVLEIARMLGGAPTLLTSYVADCAISRSWSVSRPLVRLLLGVLTPFACALTIVLLSSISGDFSGRQMASRLQFVLLTFSVVSYLAYFGITELALKAFHCVSAFDTVDTHSDASSKVLADDTSVLCYGDQHYKILAVAVVVLVFFALGFPLVSLYRIAYRVRVGSRNATSVGNTLGYMFWPFQKRFYYWEAFVFARKALLAAICAFAYSWSNNLQECLSVVVLVSFLYLQISVTPYGHQFASLNNYESTSLFLTTVTALASFVYSAEETADLTKTLTAFLLLALNGVFLICVLVRAFKISKKLFEKPI